MVNLHGTQLTRLLHTQKILPVSAGFGQVAWVYRKKSSKKKSPCPLSLQQNATAQLCSRSRVCARVTCCPIRMKGCKFLNLKSAYKLLNNGCFFAIISKTINNLLKISLKIIKQWVLFCDYLENG